MYGLNKILYHIFYVLLFVTKPWLQNNQNWIPSFKEPNKPGTKLLSYFRTTVSVPGLIASSLLRSWSTLRARRRTSTFAGRRRPWSRRCWLRRCSDALVVDSQVMLVSRWSKVTRMEPGVVSGQLHRLSERCWTVGCSTTEAAYTFVSAGRRGPRRLIVTAADLQRQRDASICIHTQTPSVIFY